MGIEKQRLTQMLFDDMAKIYKMNGEVLYIEPKNGSDFSLEELKEIVRGYIEILPLAEDEIMVLNEEGKCKNLTVNTMATYLLWDAGYHGDYIVGDVLVCKRDEVK